MESLLTGPMSDKFFDIIQAEIGRFAEQNRVSVPLSEVPQHVQDAIPQNGRTARVGIRWNVSFK